MKGQKNRVSFVAVRNANGRLVSKAGKSNLIVSDNSKNGDVNFKAAYSGRFFEFSLSKAKIKSAYAKSIAETTL